MRGDKASGADCCKVPEGSHLARVRSAGVLWSCQSPGVPGDPPLCLGKLSLRGILSPRLRVKVPNPLFDLAGITCGFFMIPFRTFAAATFLGKAVIKASIQVSYPSYRHGPVTLPPSLLSSYCSSRGTTLSAPSTLCSVLSPPGARPSISGFSPNGPSSRSAVLTHLYEHFRNMLGQLTGPPTLSPV